MAKRKESQKKLKQMYANLNAFAVVMNGQAKASGVSSRRSNTGRVGGGRKMRTTNITKTEED